MLGCKQEGGVMNEWKTQPSVWVIKHVVTGQFYLCRSSKVGWVSSGGALSAFKLDTGVSIKDQDTYELLEIKSNEV